MVDYHGARSHEDDIDFIPLMTVPADEQDVTDQHLPTYDEVRAEQETQQAPQIRSEEQAWRPRPHGAVITTALANEAQRNPNALRRQLRKGKWVIVCMALAPGIGLTLGAVIAYNFLAQAWLTSLAE